MIQLGIVGALPDELRTLTRAPLTPGQIVRLSVGVRLVLSGIGARRARAAGRLLLEDGATALLSWGCAAALAKDILPGSLLLPQRVIAADGCLLPVCPDWRQRLHQCLAGDFTTYTGALLETPVILTDPVHKQVLFQRSGALAADMESAALSALAREAQVPFMSIRVIADSATMGIPESIRVAISPVGKVDLSRLLRRLILHPQEWLGTARLAHGFRKARITLSGVSRHAGTHLLAVT